MNLTFGFIAFFISIIIPGILFRRFYYSGEFSKQFHTKDLVLHSIYLSIVPGVCIQILCLFFLGKINYFEIENLTIFNVFTDFAYPDKETLGNDTLYFLDSGLGKFIEYSLIVFIISSLLGFSLFLLIRGCQLDRRSKVFRFKNQWYYIFSGEVLRFSKFKQVTNVNYNRLQGNQKTLATYADIMVVNSEGNRELYTGFVVDYDLNQDDISQLDKIYLLDAYRYRKPKNVVSATGQIFNNVSSTNDVFYAPEVKFKDDNLTRTRVGIPGDVFIVTGKNILNINLTFVPSKEQELRKVGKKQNLYRYIALILTLLTIIFIILNIFPSLINFEEESLLGTYFNKSTFWGKLYSILYFNQILGLIFPIKKRSGGYSFNMKTTLLKIVIVVVMTILFFIYFVPNNYVCVLYEKLWTLCFTVFLA